MSAKHLLIIGFSICALAISGCGKHDVAKRPDPVTPSQEQPTPTDAPTPSASSDDESPSEKPQDNNNQSQTEPADTETGTETPSETGPDELTPAQPEDPSLPLPEPTPEPTPTPVPAPAPTEEPAPPVSQPAPQNPQDGEWLFTAIKAERLSVKILDNEAIQRVIDSRYNLAFYDGQVEALDIIATKMVANGGTYCTVIVTDEFNSEIIGNGKTLNPSDIKEETTQNGFRSLLIMFPAQEMGISCLKMTSASFKVNEIRRGLKGVFDFTIAH